MSDPALDALMARSVFGDDQCADKISRGTLAANTSETSLLLYCV